MTYDEAYDRLDAMIERGEDPENLSEEDRRDILDVLDYLKDRLEPRTESQCELVQGSGQADDLISRQSAIEAFYNLEIEIRPSAIDAIVNMLENLPSMRAECKTGKWIKTQTVTLGECVECSLCGNKESRLASGWWNGKKYCPNCGARMEGFSATLCRLS